MRRAAHAAAAGALGVTSKALGKHLRLHPVLVVWGQFDEPVRPWEGMLSSTYSDQDMDMDGRGYGVKYEHVAIPPSILLSFSPWRGGRQHAELMQALPYTGGLGVLLRDHGVGEVRGRPRRRADRPLQAHAPERGSHAPRGARRGAGGSRRWGRAGSTRRTRSGSPTSRARAATWTGSCATPTPAAGAPARRSWSPSTSWAAPAWAARPADSVCDPTGQVWDTPGLYVIDGSAFPTASGVNPMVTIEALAHMNAGGSWWRPSSATARL